jgi:hypothetical protein
LTYKPKAKTSPKKAARIAIYNRRFDFIVYAKKSTHWKSGLVIEESQQKIHVNGVEEYNQYVDGNIGDFVIVIKQANCKKYYG